MAVVAVQTDFPSLNLLEHPIAQHKLAYMRDKLCSMSRFRELARELGALLAYETTRDLASREASVATPSEVTPATILAHKPVFVALLRTGLALVEGAMTVFPTAAIGHMGLARGPDGNVMDYLVALPAPEQRLFVLMDVAIGGGDTMSEAIRILGGIGMIPQQIRVATILLGREGLQKLADSHPNVGLYAVAIERDLDEKQHYNRPGFGDAEARLFGL